MKIEITVCDVDQEVGKPTRTYTIAVDGRQVRRDLCEKHAAPLEMLLHLDQTKAASGAKPPPAPTVSRPAKATQTAPKRRARTTRITSLDEIEAMKQ
ncbi:DNA binding protein [Streptomyces phage TuanPN]|nr:DNA binding protein [Streptomyces phage TuanPN]USH46037.1 DNA binding protein [Streptomyces phage Ejemplo]